MREGAEGGGQRGEEEGGEVLVFCGWVSGGLGCGGEREIEK